MFPTKHVNQPFARILLSSEAWAGFQSDDEQARKQWNHSLAERRM